MPRRLFSPQATPLVVQEHIQMWGKAIKQQRLFLRLTAAQLASRVGVSVPTVARLEKGDPGVGIGSYLSALFALGLNSAATPVLDPAFWNGSLGKRVQPTRLESGEEIGYF